MSRRLAEVSEREALAAILPLLPLGDSTRIGPGDDSAVLRLSSTDLVVSTDTMVEGPDFRLGWSTPFDLGWKIVAVNLADIAAMGARPTALVVALGAPGTMTLDDLIRLAEGMAAACAHLAPGVGVVGGDLASSEVLTLAVTALGELDGRPAVTRAGARVGDVVAHAGRRGAAARGLARLFADGVRPDGSVDVERTAALREVPDVVAQLRPTPPIEQGSAAGIAGANAMLDVSDGLAQDAERIARASGVGVSFSDRIADEWELHGGEDHGLLATFPPDVEIPNGFEVVGEVTAESGVVRWLGDRVEPRRWEALAANEWRSGR